MRSVFTSGAEGTEPSVWMSRLTMNWAEMYPTEVKKDVVLKDGTLKLQGTMKIAGFALYKVKAHVDGRTYEGLATSAMPSSSCNL